MLEPEPEPESAGSGLRQHPAFGLQPLTVPNTAAQFFSPDSLDLELRIRPPTLALERPTAILGVPSRLIVVAGRVGAGLGPVVGFLEDERCFRHANLHESTVAVACDTGRSLSALLQLDALSTFDNNEISVMDHLFARVLHLTRGAGSNTPTDCVVEGLRTAREAGWLRERGASLLLVETALEIRHQRLGGRSPQGRTFSAFAEDDARQEGNWQELSPMADHCVSNDGTPEALCAELARLFEPRAVLELRRARQRLCWGMSLHARLGKEALTAALPGGGDVHGYVATIAPTNNPLER